MRAFAFNNTCVVVLSVLHAWLNTSINTNPGCHCYCCPHWPFLLCCSLQGCSNKDRSQTLGRDEPSSETELRLFSSILWLTPSDKCWRQTNQQSWDFFLQYCDLPLLINVEDRQNLKQSWDFFLQYCDLPLLINVEDRQINRAETFFFNTVTYPFW